MLKRLAAVAALVAVPVLGAVPTASADPGSSKPVVKIVKPSPGGVSTNAIDWH